MAPNGLLCADVTQRNYSLIHSLTHGHQYEKDLWPINDGEFLLNQPVISTHITGLPGHKSVVLTTKRRLLRYYHSVIPSVL